MQYYLSSILETLTRLWQVNELLGLSTALFLWFKGSTTVMILCIFVLHKERSLDPEFMAKYPNLIAKSSRKTYLKFQTFFVLVPFADYYFFYRCFRYRFSTVAFLKDYALPRKLFEPSPVVLSSLAAKQRRIKEKRKLAEALVREHQLKLAKELRASQSRVGYALRAVRNGKRP